MTNKELIVKGRAEPIQGMANGGLRQVKSLAGAGEALFLIYGVKYHQQIKIKLGYIHFIYASNKIVSLVFIDSSS
jgi:hypothetical protein